MNTQALGSLKERLVGTWTLQSYVETNTDTQEVTEPMGRGPHGFIIYTSDGYMSAQISAAGRSSFSADDMFGGSGKEYTEAGQSYLAYSGPFDVDEGARKVFHNISVSLYPNWVGMRQVRIVTLTGDTLRLSFESPQLSRGAMRTADLVWIRAAFR
ncbi:TPA: lipocalin-like domain-containing protein [Burkholderia cenocepacia]|nr:lipocalin-like domain-containing protein [Burkholderia cenocepacia]